MTYPDSNDYLSNVTDDYRPPHMRHAERVMELMKNEPPPAAYVQLDPLHEIASIMRRLTYSQMMEFSAGIGVEAGIIHNWAEKMP